MFSRRYFGARYYAPRYFGGGAGVTPPQPPIVVVRRPGAEDPREHFERREREWKDDLRQIIDRSWKVVNGEIDPAPVEDAPTASPADHSAIVNTLADQGNALDQARANAFIAAERQRLEDEAIAVLLLA